MEYDVLLTEKELKLLDALRDPQIAAEIIKLLKSYIPNEGK